MNFASRRMISWPALACAAWWAASNPAQAQAQKAGADTSSSQSSAQLEAGEPRASTSPDAAPGTDDKPKPGARNDGEATRPEARPNEEKGGKAPGDHRAEDERKGEGERKGGKGSAVDRLQLQTATVTGDQEQPKVMYIVPWKRSDIGDLSGKPMNSLLDEALAPVDRDEFKREVMYYQAVRADASQSGAPAKGAAAPDPSR